MLPSLRHARFRTLHLLMWVLMGVGVFGMSLASVLTDIHLLSHAQTRVDAHVHEGPSLADTLETENAGNALLHALVHNMDCLGHGGVLPAVLPVWGIGPVARQPAPVSGVVQLVVQPPRDVFRPPIAV